MAKKDKLDRIATWFRVVGRIAELAVQIRDKPRLLDWIAIGTTGVDVALQIRKEQREDRDYDYFYRAENGWRKLGLQLGLLAWKHFHEHAKPIVEASDDDGSWGAFRAESSGRTIGWYGKSHTDEPTQIWSLNTNDELIESISQVVWEPYDTGMVSYSPRGLSEVEANITDDIVSTNLIRSVTERVESFIDQGSRGYMLEGLPGTGKSTCIKYIAQKSNMTCLMLELSSFGAFADMMDYTPAATTVITVMRPDILVIDDIDRVAAEHQPRFLQLLEVAAKYAKVVFVSVNDSGKLIAPLKRPGRLDDHIKVPPLEPEIVRKITDEDDPEVIARMAQWPIAYVVDYRKRVETLGREAALRELDALHKRATAAETESPIPVVDYGDALVNEESGW